MFTNALILVGIVLFAAALAETYYAIGRYYYKKFKNNK